MENITSHTALNISGVEGLMQLNKTSVPISLSEHFHFNNIH